MSVTFVDSSSATARLGITFRQRRTGPEQELVSWFIEELPMRIPHGHHATIFCEPRIESGFPDLVIVIWNVLATKKWSPARIELTCNDLRLLHFLHSSGPCGFHELSLLSRANLKLSLQRLEDAEVVRYAAGKWRVRSLSHAFAARHIVAIEAKISQWNTAVQQALLNTWFASQSYVLVPRIPRGERLRGIARSHGLGIYAMSQKPIELPPRSDVLPRSYVSWLFNELAWRVAR
jgi:hypothetical protein